MDRGAWWGKVHEAAKSWTRLSGTQCVLCSADLTQGHFESRMIEASVRTVWKQVLNDCLKVRASFSCAQLCAIRGFLRD